MSCLHTLSASFEDIAPHFLLLQELLIGGHNLPTKAMLVGGKRSGNSFPCLSWVKEHNSEQH
jgi:hypothetical protein